MKTKSCFTSFNFQDLETRVKKNTCTSGPGSHALNQSFTCFKIY